MILKQVLNITLGKVEDPVNVDMERTGDRWVDDSFYTVRLGLLGVPGRKALAARAISIRPVDGSGTISRMS